MPRRVILRRQIPDDLHQIVAYLDERSTAAADRFIDRFFDALQALAEAPGRGSPKYFRDRRLSGVRSWAVPGYRNYLILYTSSDQAVIVLAVTHGARNIRTMLRQRA